MHDQRKEGFTDTRSMIDRWRLEFNNQTQSLSMLDRWWDRIYQWDTEFIDARPVKPVKSVAEHYSLSIIDRSKVEFINEMASEFILEDTRML